jgi:uncharacterized protein
MSRYIHRPFLHTSIQGFSCVASSLFASIALITSLITSEASAASFDCRKAISRQSKLVCSDMALSIADESLAFAYQDALNHAGELKDEIIENQRQWLHTVRNKCQTIPCLADAYNIRYLALTDQYLSRELEDPPIPGKSAILTMTTPLLNASTFDCKQATSLGQKLVCQDPALLELDALAKKSYEDYLNSFTKVEKKEKFSRSFEAWKKNGLSRCVANACLQRFYYRWIEWNSIPSVLKELQSKTQVAPYPPYPDKWDFSCKKIFFKSTNGELWCFERRLVNSRKELVFLHSFFSVDTIPISDSQLTRIDLYHNELKLSKCVIDCDFKTRKGTYFKRYDGGSAKCSSPPDQQLLNIITPDSRSQNVTLIIIHDQPIKQPVETCALEEVNRSIYGEKANKAGYYMSNMEITNLFPYWELDDGTILFRVGEQTIRFREDFSTPSMLIGQQYLFIDHDDLAEIFEQAEGEGKQMPWIEQQIKKKTFSTLKEGFER